MKNDHPIYHILEELDKAEIFYQLQRTRENSIMICASVIGSRIEIEVFNDGSIESSIFTGDESIISGSDFVKKIVESSRDK
ncbi:hypothetical protein [Flavobacterium sp. KACC 22761]|uniref:hypothetical protein n=1 Tax=Flavobacterium sp. KACC 22761 TaxID=3092665 RepID=UPI002A75A7E1|nr:hypothetical protein [Flavobacterium sp. KACC 22761]WPO77982.1 hypothetical protein SCB73_17070 [Flavobacterium sp. KACC 22761]